MVRVKTLKQYLVAMILVAIVPIIVAAGYAAHRAGEAFRQGSVDRLADTVMTLSGVVERDIRTNFGVAMLLASMGRDDNVSNEDQLLALMQGGGSGYKIVDEVFEGTAFDVPLSGFSRSGIPYETLRETAILGRPTVSNLFAYGPENTLNIAVMVLKSRTPGKLHFSGLVAPPSRMLRTLQTSREASSILVAVTDGQGRLVARSRNADKFIGQPVPNWATLKAVGKASGSFNATTAEGGHVIFSFRYLPQTPGWVIVLGCRWRVSSASGGCL